MTLTMYDADVNSQFPAGGDAYAAYVDGHDGDQPNYGYIVKAFPAAHHLGIAVFASGDADVLDVEARAATPDEIAAWYARQKARGVARPCIYASVSTMQASVVPVIQALPGVARSEVRLWSAHYGSPLGVHICGPSTCGLVSIDMDGTQWSDHVGDLEADQSLLRSDFFGTPAKQEDIDVRVTVVRQGSAGQAVRNWQGLLVAHGYGYLLGGRPGGSVEQLAGVDGEFGPATEAATHKFQQDRGLDATGVAAAAEWSAAVTG